jgi:predicted ArsR family transcriptional regulator
MLELTVKQIAARFKIDPLAAQKLLDFLRAVGVAEVSGKAPKPEGQRGKAPYIWLVPDKMLIDFTSGGMECPEELKEAA